ncbi:DUF2062 domain-containing protein [Falsochrobactrum shanghaiense]|uniref:DUF2062 domain-containing protein n=1 Tax=Falsochrobactrum shanghaiense TaxID=2201899 RepID=A0A316J8C7_9HYPH|nr:DUF2062 domain-containing protein [Falsochrobactrum shanghaiense]PWL18202.1 DUF2062 domain-containing protein [Falsochrobactrum shanghaiense]
MLFSRRNPPTMKERLRLLIWPRRSFSRSLKYGGKRILRIAASPHAVATGLAIGVFAAFTPFFGFHLIIALVLAYILAGNVAAAALGTAVANPLTLPFIWGGTYELGRITLGEAANAQPLHLTQMLETMRFNEIWAPVLKPMLFGSVILGAACAAITYIVTRFAVSAFRRRRLEALAQGRRLHNRWEP